MPLRTFWILPLGLALLASAGVAADWPQYRGPDANTAVAADGYPTSLEAGKNTAWDIELPGQGSSCPIVLGDAIYVTCEIEGEDGLVCYGTDGAERWRRTFGPRREARHRSATGANPTPASDGERVFAYYKSGRLVAVDLAGEEVWQRNLQEDFGPDTLWWDLGTSPVVTEAGVLIAVIQEGDSYVVTFDAATGDVVWKVTRQYERPQESDQSYTTPFVVSVDGQSIVVVFGADHLTGHDPLTGETLFTRDGYNPEDKPTWRVIASPTAADGIVVAPYGRTDFLSAVKLDRTGESIETTELWLRQRGSDVPSPVIRDGLVYQLGDKGNLDCIQLDSGELVWEGKLPRSRMKYYSTPLLAGDLLYCVREDGTGHVINVTDGMKVVGPIDLEDDTVVTPVPLGSGRLLVRTRHHLRLFGGE